MVVVSGGGVEDDVALTVTADGGGATSYPSWQKWRRWLPAVVTSNRKNTT